MSGRRERKTETLSDRDRARERERETVAERLPAFYPQQKNQRRAMPAFLRNGQSFRKRCNVVESSSGR